VRYKPRFCRACAFLLTVALADICTARLIRTGDVRVLSAVYLPPGDDTILLPVLLLPPQLPCRIVRRFFQPRALLAAGPAPLPETWRSTCVSVCRKTVVSTAIVMVLVASCVLGTGIDHLRRGCGGSSVCAGDVPSPGPRRAWPARRTLLHGYEDGGAWSGAYIAVRRNRYTAGHMEKIEEKQNPLQSPTLRLSFCADLASRILPALCSTSPACPWRHQLSTICARTLSA
jgi:hypothetical protein